ncbi:MAG: MBL fold metallo-hydrolase [Desulfovibrionaceae bacterium]|nr:MBL fold metallo-hydrolase [Desulfovibrionaceae bacterium]
MRIAVLVDNNTLIDRYFLAEPGLSLWIEDRGVRVLLDVGYSGIFLSNAARMGIDPLAADWVVLSHGHLDHTWGLGPLIRRRLEAAIEGRPQNRPRLLALPEAFAARRMGPLPEIGCLVSGQEAARHFELSLSTDPVWITDRLVFLGRIPRVFDFEAPAPVGERLTVEGFEPDLVPDDSALAYVSDHGLVVVTGCAHAGVCNTVEQARRVCGRDRVLDIIGGFHLLDPDQARLAGTVDYVRGLGLGGLHACHCTDLGSTVALAAAAPL